jgi:hypothetical protein
MKTAIIDFYNGKEEIQTMDDELPIIIFIILNTNI